MSPSLETTNTTILPDKENMSLSLLKYTLKIEVQKKRLREKKIVKLRKEKVKMKL